MAPTLPRWAKAAGYVGAAAYIAAHYLFDLSKHEAAWAAAPAVAIFLAGVWRLYVNERQHEVASMEWQIRSARRSIASREAELAEGQPFYDEDDPTEWEFKRKHWIANAQDRIVEFEAKLEQRRHS